MTREAERVGMVVVVACSLALGALAGEPKWSSMNGAISDKGLTVDPTTVEAYNAPRTWQPKAPPAGAPTRPYRTKIVSYCDEWGRHNTSGHGSGPCAWRHASHRSGLTELTKPPRGKKPWPFTHRRDRDIDGDGKTDDDMVVSLEWSMDEMLSIYPWPHGGLFPERSSEVFYGGVSWLGANVRDGWKFQTEMGINADHGPWHRAEDHPLTGAPDFKMDGSFHRNYWAIVWKREDFMNGAGQYRVTFDDTSRLASICTRRYWIGWDDVRMAVLDGKQWYISDNKSFDIPKPNNGPSLPGNDYARGRVYLLYPTRAAWAEYAPKGSRIDFDARSASFAKHEFEDVQAVGWYLAKNNDIPINSHVKWYGFESDAVVHRPAAGSTHIDMVEVRGKDVPAFRMSVCEVPYAMWRKVHRYGNSPWAPLEARYVYRKNGGMGSMQRPVAGATYSQDEPVTNMTFYDALAFCNTLSEREGRTPCYYEDSQFKTVFRNMHYGSRGKAVLGRNGQPEPFSNSTYEKAPDPKVYVRWGADGHRLATRSEWIEAYSGGETGADVAEITMGANSKGKTQAVGSKKANTLGIYDMIGNVWELVWTYGDVFDPAAGQPVTALGGDFQYPADPNAKESAASPYGDTPHDGNFNIGLRLVSREANLPAPATLDGPAELPEWTFRKGHRTAAREEANPQADITLAMVKIKGGSFLRYPDKNTISVHPFEAGKFEVTYAEWMKVMHWAEARGYEFSFDGDMGSMYWYTFPHTPEEPVTHITFHDMLVWCNALSEMTGKTPCYYADEGYTEVYRKSFVFRPLKISGPEYVDAKDLHPWIGKIADGKVKRTFYNREPWLFCRWDIDGYRLPTAAEWEYAVRGGTDTRYFWGRDDAQKINYAWGMTNAGGRTHPVGLKEPNPFGLFDICGNIAEWTWTGDMGRDQLRPRHLDLNNPKGSPYWCYKSPMKSNIRIGNPELLGGSWGFQGFNYNGEHGVKWHYGSGPKTTHFFPDAGLRVFRCEAGTHPRDGKEPLKTEIIPELVKIDAKDYDPLEGKMFRGGLARTGVHDTSGVSELGGGKWKVKLGGPVRSSPVVVDGVVYVGGGDGFCALNADDGKELWKVPIRGGSESSACIADGVAYFCGNDGALRAVHAKTGEKEWTYRPKRGAALSKSSPAVAYGVVFGTLDGLVGIDAKTGEKIWFSKEAKGNASEWLASMAIVGDRIYYTGNGTWVAPKVLDIPTGLHQGETEWSKWINHAGVYNTPAVANGRVYVMCSTGVGVRPVSGSGGKGGFSAYADPDIGVNQFKTNSSATVWNDLLIFGMDRGAVYCYNALKGGRKWTFETGKPVRSSPGVAAKSGLVYFGCNDGKVYCLDAKTGAKKWDHATGGAVVSSPWPADGVVYVGSDDGHVYALH